MRLIYHYKGVALSFVIFAWAFHGNWVAGFFCWLVFVVALMPKAWRTLDF